MRSSAAIPALLALFLTPAYPAEIPVNLPLTLRWDNTVDVTEAFRLDPASSALLANPNGDDGDRAFGPGLISSRFDLLSEIEARWDGGAARLSAAAWYDPLYRQTNANTSPATFNPVSVPHNEFPRPVQRQEGLDAELLDAVVRLDRTIAGLPVTLRIGQFGELWGESLYLAKNGIAGALAPLDVVRSLALPGTPARELYLPQLQAALTVVPATGWSAEFLIQPVWRRDRLPGVASYFSTTDFLDLGGERLFLPGYALPRVSDREPQSPQLGLALRHTQDDLTLGLYVLRFNAKEPVVAVFPNAYRLTFPAGIFLLGASASGSIGTAAFGAEISWRHGMPLAASLIAGGSAAGGGPGPVYAGPEQPANPGGVPAGQHPGPRGDTLHAQANLSAELGPSRLWNDAALSGELGVNTRLAIDQGAGQLSPQASRTEASFRLVFMTQYFQVVPGLDLTPGLSLGAGLLGNGSLADEPRLGAGDLTVSVEARYRVNWSARLQAVHFLGRPSAQPLADRDFVALRLSRSF